MKAEELRSIQAPLKERYRGEPAAALVTLRAQGRLGEGMTCRVQTSRALVDAGLHPATGGTGLHACSGDMLLEALVACAGVTRLLERPGWEIRLRLLEGRLRQPLALRRDRLCIERLGASQRPLEVGRDELDVGERLERH